MRCSLAMALLLSGWSGMAQEPVQALSAWADSAGKVHVRWLTTSPAVCEVVVGDQRIPEDPSCLRGTTNNRDAGTGFAVNHRADFPAPGTWPLPVTIVGKLRDGTAFATEAIRVAQPVVPTGTVGRSQIAVTIDPGDWSGTTFPLSFGVPFPKGALVSPENVQLDPARNPLPGQCVAVTRWHDDQSIKWLRVDTVVPKGVRQLVLEFGTNVAPLPCQPWPMTGDIAALAQGLQLVDADGQLCPAQMQEPVIEEPGTIKRVQRLSGTLAPSGLTVVLRLHEWVGVPGQRLDVTLENPRTDQEMTALRSFSLRLPLAGTLRVGDLALPNGTRVLQREDHEFVVTPGDATGQRLDGIVRGDRNAVVLRNCWEQWPVAVRGEDGAVVFELCPDLPEGFYANRPDEDKLYYQIRDGKHSFRQGWSKTWHFWLGPATEAAGLAGELPVASLPPAWIEDSGALRHLAIASRDAFPGYDQAVADAIAHLPDQRERNREFGMMNFGDWYGERRWNWGNLEYDTGHAWLTQFVRTGNATFQRRAEEAVRHQRDVDTRHYAADPRRVGQQWIHSIGHTAGYYDNAYKHMKVYAGQGWSDNRGHVWSQGMFEHYLLGGDTRSWETAKLVADWAAGPQITNFQFGNAREPGWMTKLVMSAYYATEDPFYLNAASEMLRVTHEKSVATGDHGFYYHPLPAGHCDCPAGERHEGEAGFMLGVLMTGMKMYYDATGDETVADDIAKTGRFIVDTMWDPKEMGFRYTSCPRTGVTSASVWIMLEGLAFAANRRHDAQMADICRLALCQGWQALGGSGKGSGYVLCNSAQALDEFARLAGPGFAEFRLRRERITLSPAQRLLPLLVPNPDFEEGIDGWPSRGWTVERSTEVHHGGEASLRISGTVGGQNEYVNTRYDTASSPYEIRWLRPGGRYELSAWLRVDHLPDGAPTPSLRVTFRDAQGSRNGAATPAYDRARIGTWQRLAVLFDVPAWNTRNYLALNTNSRDDLTVEMYLDDVHLTPAGTPAPESPFVLRLDPTQAGGAAVAACPDFLGDPGVHGPGAAVWTVPDLPAGTYQLWARLGAGTSIAAVTANQTQVAAPLAAGELGWFPVGPVGHAGGELQLGLAGLNGQAQVGRLVLTNVGSEPPSP